MLVDERHHRDREQQGRERQNHCGMRIHHIARGQHDRWQMNVWHGRELMWQASPGIKKRL
jgi:hypothetical protein